MVRFVDEIDMISERGKSLTVSRGHAPMQEYRESVGADSGVTVRRPKLRNEHGFCKWNSL